MKHNGEGVDRNMYPLKETPIGHLGPKIGSNLILKNTEKLFRGWSITEKKVFLRNPVWEFRVSGSMWEMPSNRRSFRDGETMGGRIYDQRGKYY